MVSARRIYTFIVEGEHWSFLGNGCMEQSIAKIGDGRHAGPVLPFRVAAKITSKVESWKKLRYCVDDLGRIWYSITDNEQPSGYFDGYFDSPCRRACLAALEYHGADIDEVMKAHEEGEAFVEHLANYKDDDE